MGVYIPGMKMPDTCEDCPFYIEGDEAFGFDDWCFVLDRTLGRCPQKETDGYSCPLISTTEHGRLIDADDFFRTFPELIPYEFSAPTIIPADA